MDEWSLLQTMGPLHYGEACLPATCLPACLLLALLQNNHLPHIARLKTFRNHIRLIDKDHTPIYCSIKPTPAHSSPAKNYFPVSPQPHSTNQSTNACIDQWNRGSEMTRTSFLLFFVSNCYGSDMCSPAPSLEAEITLFQSRISSSQ